MTYHKSMEYYKKEEGKERIICLLCRHACKLKEGQVGICGVNKNVEGELKTLVYGHPIALNVDPIEKKPLYRLLPGSKVLSFGTVGVPYSYDEKETLEENPWLQENGAAFVTLTTKAEQLRGCIGSLVAHRKLYDDVIENAKNAAIHDPRFVALTEDEFKDINVEVSILTPAIPLIYNSIEELKSKIKVGVDGVILKYGKYQATFLPQVWEQLPSFELFFAHLCKKAGMGESCLSQKPEIAIYQVKKYK